MFFDVKQTFRQQPRYPVLVLDQTAKDAFRSGRGIYETTEYRITEGLLRLEREECVEAQRAGGMILLSGILNPDLDAWMKLLDDAGLKALAVLLCPETGTYRQHEGEIRKRLKSIAARGASVFPVYTHEIERRICCDEHEDLRQSAQGFAVSSILEALEQLGSGGAGEDCCDFEWPQTLNRPGFLACTTAIPSPGISIPEQVERLSERLFWQNSSLNHAMKILVRLEVPEGTGAEVIRDWQDGLQNRFPHSELECRYWVGPVDSSLRVSLLFTGLTVQKVRWSQTRQSILELVHAGLWSENKATRVADKGQVVPLLEMPLTGEMGNGYRNVACK